MRTIIWFIYFWLYLIALLPQYFYLKYQTKRGKTQHVQEIVDKCVANWARRLIALAGGKVHVSGLENIPKDTAVLFVGNHQGDFDIPLTLAYLDRPHGLIAKISTEKIPFISTWMKMLHCVFIDRENPRASMKALGEATENILNGHSMIIFPEGTRSKSDRVGEFKSGSMRIALKAKVPIVPIAIDNTYKMLEEHKFLIKPADIYLRILPPIDTAALTKEESKELNEHIRQKIIQAKKVQ